MTSIGMFLLSTTLGLIIMGGQYAVHANEEGAAAGTNAVASSERSDLPETNALPALTIMESTLPPDVAPDSSFAQLVRMVQAGVDKAVILAYIAKSPRFFELDADDIIYLSDIGAPPEVITAAMERDEQLIEEGIGFQSDTPESAEPSSDAVAVEPPEVSMSDFYTALAPYGSWIYIEGYGRCWRPSVVIYNTGWQPYCDAGRWVYTDCGWYWMSNYSWGWAPFHYGRWFRHARYGWCWWPDTVWAPSWVHWRYSSSYCGWAPLPPYTVYRSGVGLVYRGSVVSVGFGFNLGYNCYTFVPPRYFCDYNLRRHCVPRKRVEEVYRTTLAAQHRVDVDEYRRIINRGVPVDRIASATQREIKPVSIRYATNHAGRRSGSETFDRSGRTMVVNRSSASARTGAPVNTRTDTRSRITRSRTSDQRSRSAVNQTRTRTTPPPARVRSSTPRSSGNRDAVSTPRRSTPPATPQGNESQRSTVRGQSRPAPSVRQNTPPGNNIRSNPVNRSTPQVQPRRSTTPSPGSASRANRVQPKSANRPSQARPARSSPRPAVSRSNQARTPSPSASRNSQVRTTDSAD